MDNHTIVIAEAGVNHNGSIDMAKQLIDAASEAGVDYVKFQTFKAGNLVTKSAAKAEYQKRNIDDNDNSQYAMLKKLELSSEWHFELIDYCTQRGVSFFRPLLIWIVRIFYPPFIWEFGRFPLVRLRIIHI